MTCTDASLVVPLVVLHPSKEHRQLVQLGHGGNHLQHLVQLIADVHRPIRIRSRRRHDQDRVGEDDRAEGVCLVCGAYDGVFGGVAFDGEAVGDLNTVVCV